MGRLVSLIFLRPADFILPFVLIGGLIPVTNASGIENVGGGLTFGPGWATYAFDHANMTGPILFQINTSTVGSDLGIGMMIFRNDTLVYGTQYVFLGIGDARVVVDTPLHEGDYALVPPEEPDGDVGPRLSISLFNMNGGLKGRWTVVFMVAGDVSSWSWRAAAGDSATPVNTAAGTSVALYVAEDFASDQLNLEAKADNLAIRAVSNGVIRYDVRHSLFGLFDNGNTVPEATLSVEAPDGATLTCACQFLGSTTNSGVPLAQGEYAFMIDGLAAGEDFNANAWLFFADVEVAPGAIRPEA